MVYIFHKSENSILRFCDNATLKAYTKNTLVADRIAQKTKVINEYLLRSFQFCAFARFAICAFALLRNFHFCAIFMTAMTSFCDIAILRSKSQIAMSQIHKSALFKDNLPIYQYLLCALMIGLTINGK